MNLTLVCKLAPAALQLINVCSWVFPNAILLRHTCQWFDPFVVWGAFVSWTCWNTIFLIMCIEAHNCAPWAKGRATSKGGALHLMSNPCLTQAMELPWNALCSSRNGCFDLIQTVTMLLAAWSLYASLVHDCRAGNVLSPLPVRQQCSGQVCTCSRLCYNV